MRLYLSSYRLGNYAEELKALVGKTDAKVAVCVNAMDGEEDNVRNEIVLQREIDDMKSLGFEPEELDLRKYFDRGGLIDVMKSYDLVWVSGGNTFLLAKAFRQSGFDEVLSDLVKNDKLVYAGYSAAFCVLAESLHGIELVDDKDASVEGYVSGEIWEGIGLIDFHPIVHFRSNHHESDDIEKEYDFVVKNKIPHKIFKDGDVYLVDGQTSQVLL